VRVVRQRASTASYGRGVQADQVVVRDARAADLQATAELIAADKGEPVSTWVEHFARVHADPDRHFLVALVGRQIAGFGQSRRVVRGGSGDDEAPGGWYLSGVTVAAPHRRKGIGHRLTAERLQRLRPLTDVVHYAADPAGEATIAMHEAFGFRQVGTVTIPGVAEILLLFRLDLRSADPAQPRPASSATRSSRLR
jgi:ribosomal protein S18 acetylase RimI-like enzyme